MTFEQDLSLRGEFFFTPDTSLNRYGSICVFLPIAHSTGAKRMFLKVGIVQSNYLPWRGYFDFIQSVDHFIFLDDVQYTRRDWRNRNRICGIDGPEWISVPTFFSRSNPTTIDNTLIDCKTGWKNTHLVKIANAYKETPYFDNYFPSLKEILLQSHSTISNLNISLIKFFMDVLDIKTVTSLSRAHGIQGMKSTKLSELVRAVGGTVYVSGPAAKSYLEQEEFLNQGIQVLYKAYNYLEYPQRRPTVESLSILDLVFNCGHESRYYLHSNPPFEATEM